MVGSFFMSNNSAAIGTMLKTFIASIRSDGAEVELNKLGIKLKEVGTDGVERFRDIQQVILDIAVATKYTNSDIQNVLLKISGGKYQWSKVAAMLSDYKEIVHNWELAINSQGFTEGQVMEQMDTVARKWQTLKDQLEGLIVNAGNGGVQDAIKGLIDRISTILEFLNNLSPATITAITKFTELAVAIYTCNRAVTIFSSGWKVLVGNVIAQVAKSTGVAVGEIKSLSQAFSILRANGGTALTTLKVGIQGLMASTGIGILVAVIGEAAVRLMEYSNSLDEASEKAANLDADRYDAQTRLISTYQQQIEFVGALTTSYVGLLKASEDESLAAEKKTSLTNDITEAEKQLTEYIGKSGIERIKVSDDMVQAAQEETNKFAEGNQKKIESSEKLQEAIVNHAQHEIRQAQELIVQYENERKAFHENVEKKIEDIHWLSSMEVAFYKLKYNLYKADTWLQKKKVEGLQGRVNNLNDRYKASGYNDTALRDRAYQLQKELDTERAKLIEDREDESRVADEIFEAAFGGLKEKAMKAFNTYGRVVTPNGGVSDGKQSVASGGDETETKEPSSSKSSRGGGTGARRGQAYKDNELLALEGQSSAIDTRYQQAIGNTKKLIETYGASKELTMAIDKYYEDWGKERAAIKEQIVALLAKRDNSYFDSQLITGAGDELRQQVFDSVSSYLGTDYLFGGTSRSGIDCSGLAQAVYRSVGIELSRTADYQADDFINSGTFHYGTEGIKKGDLVFFSNPNDNGANGIGHVGVYAGEGQFIEARKKDTQVDYSTLEGRNPIGYGSLSELAATRGVQVGYSQTLKDLGVDENLWKQSDTKGKQSIISNLKNRADLKENTAILDYLDKVNEYILANAAEIENLNKQEQTRLDNQAKDMLSNSKAEVEARKTEVSQRNTAKTLAFGLSIRDLDEQRMKLEETKVAYQALNEVLPRFNKNTQAHKQLVQETNQAQLDYMKQQKTVIESMYDRREKLTERMFKGKGAMGTDPRVNTQATQELTKLMVSLGNLRIKKELMKKQNMLNQDEEWALDDQIEDAAKKVKESMEKYRKTVSDSLESIAEQFVFDGKELTDIFNDAWTALGRDAMKLLFGQKLENPSMLTQMLGYNKADVEKAKEDATKALMDGNTDALGLNTNALVDLTTAINLVTDFLGINKPQMGMGGAPSEVGKSYFTSPALAEFARMNNPALASNSYSFDSASQLAWSKPSMATDMSSIRGQYTFNTMNDKLVTTNDKLVTGMASLSSNMVTLNTTSLQGNIAEKESTKATGQNTASTMQLVAGVAGIGNAFANGDWASGLFGLAQLGMGFGWFGGLKATGGKFATGGNMSAAGKVTGAGSGRSDSILAYLANKGKFVMLSNGEYVINEKSAKALGYDTLDQLNGYATGGNLSGSPTNPTPYVPTINQQVAQKAISIHGNSAVTEKLLREQNQHMVEQNTLLKGMGESGGGGQMVVLNTQASSADVLKALQENPRAVQAILGRQNRMGFR